MRIFLDANILFSAACSAGAIRQLVQALQAGGHSLVADAYVAEEARRNLASKAQADALEFLQALLEQMQVSPVQHLPNASPTLQWLSEKDRPVLLAAIALRCSALVTGDRTHFGPAYGQSGDGVTVYSPAQLALTLFPAKD